MKKFTKYTISLVLAITSWQCYAQAPIGAFNISAFSNQDNQLKNNTELSSLILLVIYEKTKDTIIHGTIGLPIRKNVAAGKYKLVAINENQEVIEAVFVVNPDQIRFVDLLFEPKKQKRKRFVTGYDK